MERVGLDVERRTAMGKKARFLRKAGITPANIYGTGMESIAIQAPSVKLGKALALVGHTSMLDLKIAGESAVRPVLVRAVRHHALADTLVHVDFDQVDLLELGVAEVPLVFVGESAAVKRGSVLLYAMSHIQVEALPTEIPAEITVDISGLVEDDEALHVRDLPLPAGVTAIDADNLVVKVQAGRKAEVEVAETPAPEAVPAAEA